MIRMNNYQVFIASSLQLQDLRNAADESIKIVNENKEVKGKHIQFNAWVYEKSHDPQVLKKKDAQEGIDPHLKESTLFFLIIDDVIHSMAEHEFEVALKQHDKGCNPAYIFIFYNGESIKSDQDGLGYNEFLKSYNLMYYVKGHHNDIVPHTRIYGIPFNNIDEFKEKIIYELLSFVSSPLRPISGACRGFNLTKENFFSDMRRIENCPDDYFRRNFDDLLDSAIKEGKRNFVALIGHSLSGKTRAVMEAMKAVDDGWVYIVNMESAVTEFEQLTNYLKQPEHPRLYIVLDDFDQWAGQKAVSDALDKLLRVIWGSNDVIIATASSTNHLPNKDDQEVELIEIPEMSESEFGKVRDFFISAGAVFDKGNLRYHRTGALFVNLKEIQRVYSTWLDKEDDTELAKQAKQMLLKAIKALSIWRDDNIGNRLLMEQLATWFCTQSIKRISNRKKIEWDEGSVSDICHEVLGELILDKRMGASSAGDDSPVIVQEYIYRYFIDFDGSLLKDDESFSADKEKKLIRDLLLFCSDQQKQEPLTAQVSRLCRRCAFKDQIVSWLYHLWLGEDKIDPSDHELSELLKNDRIKCENSDDKLISHFYSNIIETYIYFGCVKWEEAHTAFECCPKKMRTDHLFSALMRKAKPEERDRVRNIPDYKSFIKDAYVIAVEIEWAKDYPEAKKRLEDFSIISTYGNSPQKVIDYRLNAENKEKETSGRLYELIQLQRSVATLATKVGSQKDFEDFCTLVGDLYLYLTDNITLLNDIKSKQKLYNADKLTRIDRLAMVQPSALTRMLGNVFYGDLTASEAFVKSLLNDVKKTLDGPFTDEQTLRLTFGYAVSKLIRTLADVPYDEVYNRIFTPLKTEYNNKTLILRNIYTYTAMLGNDKCDMQKANDLLITDLHNHIQDTGNPLTINTITLNMIMKKSSGRNRGFNVNMINNIYDTLHIKRDSHTYRYLISAASDYKQALGILKEMQDRKVTPNIYILCELMNHLELRTALSMLDLRDVNLPKDYEPHSIKSIPEFDPKDVIDGLRLSMSETQRAWGYLFKKRCLNKHDKEALTACLAFLEEKRPELLESGYIYNCLISNESYFPFVNDVKNFINKKRHLLHSGSFPDSYTAKYIIDRITQLNGTDRIKAIDRLNEVLNMIIEGKKGRLDSLVVEYRLRIYRNQSESFKMDFYNERGEKILKKGKDGKERQLELSARGYLEKMSQNGYQLESAIASFLSIVEGLTSKSYNKLKEIPEMETVLNKPMVQNKLLLWQYKAGEIMIDDALQKLNWTNVFAATCIFGEILNCYIDSQPRTPSLFRQVMEYFNKWVTNKDRFTTSITLSVLAKATANWDDMNSLLVVFDEQKEKNPRLSLTPQMLTAMSAYANTVNNLINWTSVMFKEGCPSSSQAADSYVLRMASYLLEHDRNATEPILDDLCTYVVEGGDAEEMLVKDKRIFKMLEKDERIFLMLDLYKEKKNVSASLLRTIIYYNATNVRQEQDKWYDMVKLKDCIITKYRNNIIPLMELLAADALGITTLLPLREGMESSEKQDTIKTIADYYIPFLFYENKRSSLSDRLLSYIAYGLPKGNLNNYRHFLKKLNEIDCRKIEGAVPGLAAFLKNYVDSHTDNSKDLDLARKALSRIIVYTNLKQLRNRDLLLEEVSEEYAVWGQYLMDCEKILKNGDSKWQESFMSIQWSELIRKYTNWLDDSYPSSLSLCKVDEEHPLPNELKDIICNQERCYTQRIETGEVYFKDVLFLPKKWIYAQWWDASEKLAMSIVRRISRMAYNLDSHESYFIDDYIKDAKNRINAIINSYIIANSQHLKDVHIYYKDIGDKTLKDDKKSFIKISLFSMRALRYDISLDRMAGFCESGSFMSENECKILHNFEKECANYIEKKGADMAWLQQLPERWEKIKTDNGYAKNTIWRPDDAMVIAILKNYVRIALGDGSDAAIAQKYVNRVKKAINFAREKKYKKVKVLYSMLGKTNNPDFYLLVSFKSISKVNLDNI